MAKLSSKAGTALDKVLRRKTLVEIQGFISTLQSAVRNDDVRTAYIEQEAGRVLDVRYYADGKEIIDQGPLESNLTEGLDGPDLVRAIAVATSVFNSIKAEREAWLADNKRKWEENPTTRHIRYKEDVNHGPGVAIPPVGQKP